MTSAIRTSSTGSAHWLPYAIDVQSKKQLCEKLIVYEYYDQSPVGNRDSIVNHAHQVSQNQEQILIELILVHVHLKWKSSENFSENLIVQLF